MGLSQALGGRRAAAALLVAAVLCLVSLSSILRAGQPNAPTTSRVARRMTGTSPSVKDMGLTEDVPRSKFRDCELCSTMPQQLLKLLSYYDPFSRSVPDRMIVVARHKEDTSWLDVYLSDVPHVVYQVADSAAKYTTSTNKGNEATPYLQYIIDNYDSLPKSIVFSHGHKYVPYR